MRKRTHSITGPIESAHGKAREKKDRQSLQWYELGHDRGRVLSDRQLTVLQQIALGHSDFSIANILGISEFSVKTHVKELLSKLRAKNRAHAVSIAFRRGILQKDRISALERMLEDLALEISEVHDELKRIKYGKSKSEDFGWLVLDWLRGESESELDEEEVINWLEADG